MFKLTKIALITISFFSISSNAYSKEISYDYLQVTYESVTDDSLGIDVDGDGFGFSGSFSVSPNMALVASYGSVSYDEVMGISIDTNALSFGLTGHTALGPGTDIYGTFAIIDAEFEVTDGVDSVSEDDTGNLIVVGIRSMVATNVELDVGFGREDVFDDSSTAFGLGARFFVAPKIALGIAYTTGDDVDTMLLSARFEIK